jgi:23S rRNA pseudouridine2605 synthase
LAEGAVEEVRTRVLREQLGEKLVERAGVDLSTPIAPPPPRQKRNDPPAKAAPPQTPEKRQDRKDHQERRDHQDRKERKSRDHAWRAREPERPTKLLRRSFRGARRNDKKRQPSNDEARMGLLTDRKGRRVAVERRGEAPPPKVVTAAAPKRGRGRHRAPDRSSGARPRQPRTR